MGVSGKGRLSYELSRIHEVLARDKTKFDQTSTLLTRDVSLKKVDEENKTLEFLAVHLEVPKEEKLSQGVTIELFETGNFTCSVAAYKKWRQLAKMGRKGEAKTARAKPILRMENGETFNINYNFTCKTENVIYVILLGR